MRPRLLYLLSAEHPPPCERDRLDAWTAAARVRDRRRPGWTDVELGLAA